MTIIKHSAQKTNFNFNYMNKTIRQRILILITIILPMFANAATLNGSWQRHPSFYQQIEKIIDGDRYTYFLLHQQLYVAANATANQNTATLFRYDKKNESNGIKALAADYENMPIVFRIATYSPVNKWLVASAEDGSIWVIPDDSEPFAIFGLDNISLPGKPQVKTLTENPEDGSIWIAATYGYSKVNPATRSIEKTVMTDFPIDWICQVGDDIVVFSEDKAFTASASAFPASKSSFSNLTVNSSAPGYLTEGGTLKSPANLMPLSSKSFGFFGPRSEDTAGKTIAVASKNGNQWSVLPLKEDAVTAISDANKMTVATADNGYANKDGYFVNAKDNVYQIKKGIDPAQNESSSDYASKVLTSVAKSGDSGKEGSSWDFSGFWFFTPKQGFQHRQQSSGSWSNLSEMIWPNAPVPFISSTMKNHPGKGFMIINHKNGLLFDQTIPTMPWLMSTYQNGKWTNLSPVFFTPKEISGKDDMIRIFNAGIESYPVSNPYGMAIDPDNTDYIYTGSMFGGWARINLADLSSAALIVGHPKNSFVGFPSFIEGFPQLEAWSKACAVSPPHFDNKGRMWTLYADYDGSAADHYSYTLKYYNPEDLKAISQANTNPSAYKEMHTLKVHTPANVDIYEYAIPLTHPSNENVLVFSSSAYGCPVMLVDHNGTPEDTSDDRTAFIERPYDVESGAPLRLLYTSSIWEDPSTGDVWIGNSGGTFRINPSEVFDNPTLGHVNTVKSTPDGKADRKILETGQATCYVTDSFNRLWIGTWNHGLICLSPDREEILAEFMTTNSPLPSNRVYGLGFNTSSNSLMISTEGGLIEFFPGGSSLASGNVIKVSPSDVTPDFQGWLTVTGLPDSATIEIVDGNGQKAASLGKPSNGVVQWNCEDANGKRCATGTYEVRDSSSNKTYATFNILN